MKQTIGALATIGLVTACSLSAGHPDTVVIKDTNEGTKVFMLQTSKRDRLYWGPDVFWMNESPSIRGIHVKDNSVYYGLKVGYDFLRPNAIYAGADLLYALGRMHIRTSADKAHVYKDKSTGTFANGEIRVGYNFHGENKFFFTPFVGLGAYHTRPLSQHYVQNWLYVAVGAKTDYEVNENFNIGLNLKGTQALYLEQRVKKHGYSASRHSTSNALGYEIGLPLTMRVGEKRDWDIRLEPYYLKLNCHSDSNIAGGRLTASVRY